MTPIGTVLGNSGLDHVFIDESIAKRRGGKRQSYLIAAVFIKEGQQEEIRLQLERLLLPGQIKLHWTDESLKRRRKLCKAVASICPLTVIIEHVAVPQKKTERFRRKCLEHLYATIGQESIASITMETCTPHQNMKDIEHFRYFCGHIFPQELRVEHVRGGDEPLLWIPDIVLGAVNAAALGDASFLSTISHAIAVREYTADSLATRPEQNERP